MQSEDENIVLEILEDTVNAANELSNIAYSLKNTEAAYNDFVAQSMSNSFSKKDYLNLHVVTELTLANKHRLDIAVNSINDTIVAIEGVRLRQPHAIIAKLQDEKIKNYSSVNAKAYFSLIYNEFSNFEKSWNKYKKSLLDLKYNIEEVKIFSNVKLLKTKNANNTALYHIFVNLSHEKEEIISQNKLKNISISNFKRFEYISTDLSPNINIMLGKNAFGKTSFLQALALANIPDNQRFAYEDFINQKVNEAEIIIQRENERAEKTTINETGKTNDSLTKYVHEPVFLAYGTSFFSRYEQHNYSKLIEELLIGTKKWYNVDSLFEERSDAFYDPLGILNSLHELPDSEAKAIENVFVEKMNKLLPNELGIVQNDKYKKTFHFIDKNNNYLKTQQLSEGYKHNILLLTDIIIKVISIGRKYYEKIEDLFSNIKGIIAIDEFDRHMHPSWQKLYINNLQGLLPNIQFVLTTHNPVAILGRKSDEIQMFYQDKNNTLEVKQLPETISVDAGMVLLTHFEMDSILSLELQNKVDDFYNLKTKENLTNEEKRRLNELQGELNETFIGVNIHDFRFLKFLKFLKDKGFDYQERLEELIIDEADVENFRNEFKEYYK